MAGSKSGYVPFSERGPDTRAVSSAFNNEVSSLIDDLQRAAFRARSKVEMADDLKKVAHDRQLGSEELNHEIIKKRGEAGYRSEYQSPSSIGSPSSPTGTSSFGMRTAFDDNFEWARSIQSAYATAARMEAEKNREYQNSSYTSRTSGAPSSVTQDSIFTSRLISSSYSSKPSSSAITEDGTMITLEEQARIEEQRLLLQQRQQHRAEWEKLFSSEHHPKTLEDGTPVAGLVSAEKTNQSNSSPVPTASSSSIQSQQPQQPRPSSVPFDDSDLFPLPDSDDVENNESSQEPAMISSGVTMVGEANLRNSPSPMLHPASQSTSRLSLSSSSPVIFENSTGFETTHPGMQSVNKNQITSKKENRSVSDFTRTSSNSVVNGSNQPISPTVEPVKLSPNGSGDMCGSGATQKGVNGDIIANRYGQHAERLRRSMDSNIGPSANSQLPSNSSPPITAAEVSPPITASQTSQSQISQVNDSPPLPTAIHDGDNHHQQQLSPSHVDGDMKTENIIVSRPYHSTGLFPDDSSKYHNSALNSPAKHSKNWSRPSNDPIPIHSDTVSALLSFLFHRASPSLGTMVLNASQNRGEMVLPKVKWGVSIVALLKVHWSDLFRKGDAISIYTGHSGSPNMRAGMFVGYAYINTPNVARDEEASLTNHHDEARSLGEPSQLGKDGGRTDTCQVVSVVSVELGYDDMIPLHLISKNTQFVAGDLVTWIGGFDDHVPKGEVGEVLGYNERGRVRVKFPRGSWNFLPQELRKEADKGISNEALHVMEKVVCEVLGRVLTTAALVAAPHSTNTAHFIQALHMCIPNSKMETVAQGEECLQSAASTAFIKFHELTKQSSKHQRRQLRSAGNNKNATCDTTIFDERDIEILAQNIIHTISKDIKENENYESGEEHGTENLEDMFSDENNRRVLSNLELSDGDCAGLAGVLDLVIGQMLKKAGTLARSRDDRLGVINYDHIVQTLQGNAFSSFQLQHVLLASTSEERNNHLISNQRSIVPIVDGEGSNNKYERTHRTSDQLMREKEREKKEEANLRSSITRSSSNEHQENQQEYSQKEKEKYLANKKIASHLFRKAPPPPLSIPYSSKHKVSNDAGPMNEIEFNSPYAEEGREEGEREEGEGEEYFPVEQSIGSYRSAKQTGRTASGAVVSTTVATSPPSYIIPKRERHTKQPKRGSSSVLARASSERKAFIRNPSTTNPSPPSSPSKANQNQNQNHPSSVGFDKVPINQNTKNTTKVTQSGFVNYYDNTSRGHERVVPHPPRLPNSQEEEEFSKQQVIHSKLSDENDVKEGIGRQSHYAQPPHAQPRQSQPSSLLPDVTELRMEALKKAEKNFEVAKETNKKDYTLLKTLKNNIEAQRQLNEKAEFLHAELLLAEKAEDFDRCELLSSEMAALPISLAVEEERERKRKEEEERKRKEDEEFALEEEESLRRRREEEEEADNERMNRLRELEEKQKMLNINPPPQSSRELMFEQKQTRNKQSGKRPSSPRLSIDQFSRRISEVSPKHSHAASGSGASPTNTTSPNTRPWDRNQRASLSPNQSESLLGSTSPSSSPNGGMGGENPRSPRSLARFMKRPSHGNTGGGAFFNSSPNSSGEDSDVLYSEDDTEVENMLLDSELYQTEDIEEEEEEEEEVYIGPVYSFHDDFTDKIIFEEEEEDLLEEEEEEEEYNQGRNNKTIQSRNKVGGSGKGKVGKNKFGGGTMKANKPSIKSAVGSASNHQKGGGRGSSNFTTSSKSTTGGGQHQLSTKATKKVIRSSGSTVGGRKPNQVQGHNTAGLSTKKQKPPSYAELLATASSFPAWEEETY